MYLEELFVRFKMGIMSHSAISSSQFAIVDSSEPMLVTIA